MVTLHNGDCLQVLPTIPDKSVDMILCDLPYGVLNRSNEHAKWDNIIPLEPLWKEYLRVIKDNGAIVLFAQGMFTAQLMMSQPKLWRYNLVWDKIDQVTGFLNANRCPMRVHEDIAVFYKSQPTYNPQFTSGEPNHSRGHGGAIARTYGQYHTRGGQETANARPGGANPNPAKWRGNQREGNIPNDSLNQCYGGFYRTPTILTTEKYPTSIVRFSKDQIFLHPTQKPTNLCRWLIRTYTNEGETVLDNTMGSGTTGVACIMEKRNFIGIEKNEEYFKIASERIKNEECQLTLF